MAAVLLPASSNLHQLSIYDEEQCSRKLDRTINLRSVDDEQATEPPNPIFEGSDVVAETKAFGGIKNLGNTCYFNSALQLLASLDSFTQSLKTNEPRASALADAMDLRKEFLNMMESLAGGETVQPESFKKALDARTTLFIGYRQQDSHEFLTTLLELLDEDYQEKAEEKCEDTGMGDDPMDIDDQETPNLLQSDKVDSTDDDEIDMHHMHSSPLQLPCSLSELDVDDISNLLNGSPTQPLDLEKPSTKAHDFKLIGGRMSNTCTGVMQWLGGSIVQLADEDTSVSSTTSNDNSDDAPFPPDDDATSITVPAFSSPVDDHFTTQVRVQLTCDSCKYTRSHLETYRHLSLEIGTNGGSIEEGLRKLFSPEKREIKCEKCFCESATQSTEIIRLPRALLLHFKRFIVDYSADFTNATYRKNHAVVEFDERLDIQGEDSVLADFLGSDLSLPDPLWGTTSCQRFSAGHQEYRLRGIVNHHGSSASCGHYNADGYKLYGDGKREWTRFNDAIVSKITAKQALGDSVRTAYLVVYELVLSSSP